MELNQPKINWQCFHTIIFDFDGVFTNNKVYLDESVKSQLDVIEEMAWPLIYWEDLEKITGMLIILFCPKKRISSKKSREIKSEVF